MRCTLAPRFWAYAACLPAILLFSVAAAPQSVSVPRIDAKRVQVVVNELAQRLALQGTITVTVVPANPLLVSVEPERGRENGFVLSFEDSFLNALDDEGLRAVVAHELGHVWIFTHHPYLQTERLANSVAMRIVSRQSLENVYSKVWERGGTKGDLVQFLGQ